MKSLVQYGLLIVAIVGGVFAVTFFTQNTRSPVEKPPAVQAGAAVALAGDLLEVPEKRAVWDDKEPDYAIEIERGGLGNYDFWLRNPHDQPVQIALQTSSCVCTEVQIGLVPPEESKIWDSRPLKYDPASRGPDLSKVKWFPLPRRDKDPVAPSVTIPAAGSHGPQVAILRLNWNSKEVKPLRLMADVKYWIGDRIESKAFEATTVIVPPVMISGFNFSVGDLNVNDRKEMTIYCWSATRDQFTVSLNELSKDPCIEVGQPHKLTADEITATTSMLRESGAVGSTRMKSAYAVPFTVYERRNNSQLDLGPLTRRIEVRTDTGSEVYPVTITGTVRGNVQIGDRGPDQDRINLGSFRADRPHDKTVIVTSSQADLVLRKKSQKPDYLEVKLEEGPSRPGFKQWKLRIEIDANKVSGLLPPDSAVYLETVTNPPRAIRIPVLGNGTAR